jgi:hypothetical protein
MTPGWVAGTNGRFFMTAEGQYLDMDEVKRAYRKLQDDCAETEQFIARTLSVADLPVEVLPYGVARAMLFRLIREGHDYGARKNAAGEWVIFTPMGDTAISSWIAHSVTGCDLEIIDEQQPR